MTGEEIIAEAMRKTGWDKEELARRAGYETRTLDRFRRGELTNVERFQKRINEAVRNSIIGTSPRDRLRTAMENADLNPAQLAKKIHYQVGVVQAVVEGAARIKEDMAERIEKLEIGVTAEELMEGSETPRIVDPSGTRGTVGAIPNLQSIGAGKVRMIPLISMAQAGPEINFEDEVFQHEATAVFDVNDPKAFGLRIRGNSMEPEIKEGDVAIVCPGWTPRNGDEVICRTVNGDVMCKIYQTKFNDQFVILSSYNPAFPPRELSREEIEWIYPIADIQKRRRRE